MTFFLSGHLFFALCRFISWKKKSINASHSQRNTSKKQINILLSLSRQQWPTKKLAGSFLTDSSLPDCALPALECPAAALAHHHGRGRGPQHQREHETCDPHNERWSTETRKRKFPFFFTRKKNLRAPRCVRPKSFVKEGRDRRRRKRPN